MASSTTKQAIIDQLTSPQTLSLIVTLLLDVIDYVSNSATVDKIIAQIQTFLPAIIKLAPDLVSDLQTIIASLKNKNLTDAQFAALDAARTALNTQTDADIAAAIAYANS